MPENGASCVLFQVIASESYFRALEALTYLEGKDLLVDLALGKQIVNYEIRVCALLRRGESHNTVGFKAS